MSEDTYRCVCHTCEIEVVIDGLENAQEFFNEHTERAHEVELFNQETIDRYATGKQPKPDVADHQSEPENEEQSKAADHQSGPENGEESEHERDG